MPENFEEEVIPIEVEPQQEIFTATEVSEPDLASTTGETKGDEDEDFTEPPKSLEVKDDDPKDYAPIILASKAPGQTETTPMKAITAYYPYKLDEVSLVWKHTQQSSLTLKGSPSFLNLDSPTMNPISLKKRQFFDPSEDLFEVNSSSSSFKEEVSDTNRFRTVSWIFREFWESRKRGRKKLKIRQQNRSHLATRGYDL